MHLYFFSSLVFENAHEWQPGRGFSGMHASHLFNMIHYSLNDLDNKTLVYSHEWVSQTGHVILFMMRGRHKIFKANSKQHAQLLIFLWLSVFCFAFIKLIFHKAVCFIQHLKYCKTLYITVISITIKNNSATTTTTVKLKVIRELTFG